MVKTQLKNLKDGDRFYLDNTLTVEKKINYSFKDVINDYENQESHVIKLYSVTCLYTNSVEVLDSETEVWRKETIIS